MEFLQTNWPVIVAFLLALSELLALIPSIKSKSVFQLFYNTLKSVSGKKDDLEKLKK